MGLVGAVGRRLGAAGMLGREMRRGRGDAGQGVAGGAAPMTISSEMLDLPIRKSIKK